MYHVVNRHQGKFLIHINVYCNSVGQDTGFVQYSCMQISTFGLEFGTQCSHFLMYKCTDDIAEDNSNIVLLLGCVTGENSSETEEPVTETRAVLTTVTAGHWVSVGGLLPFSNYSVSVRACNSLGCVESAYTSISLPPAG